MKELLLYMAKNLVDDPEAVTVTGGASVSNNDTVERSLLSAHSSQSDFNHGFHLHKNYKISIAKRIA